MLNQMIAEICFCNSNDLSSATATLIENGFEIERLDWTDPEGGAHVWILAGALTELDQSHFLDQVIGIVDPYGGYVVEGGLELTHAPNKETDQ